jgi:hypothetical protein
VTRLLGRKKLLDQVEDAALRGRTVLLLGPMGIGKTSILAELQKRITARSVPCGLAPDTRDIGDVTAALWSAYPQISEPTGAQRHLRSRLRSAVEAIPGVLLLDHVTTAGTAMKGFLRSLRGTGFGVVLAADVENRRDHAKMRDLHLTHLEIIVPPLAGRSMASLFCYLLEGRALSFTLHDDDRKRLLRLAKGNPGRLLTFLDLLAEPRFWREGRARTTAINGEAMILALRRYLVEI